MGPRTEPCGSPYPLHYSVPNCKGRVKLEVLGKTPQVYLITKRKLSKNTQHSPPIVKNLDNFPSGAFYSIQHCN